MAKAAKKATKAAAAAIHPVIAAQEITWRSDDLPLATVESILGKDHVAMIFAMPKKQAIAFAVSRGHGAFDACDRERYAAYRSIVTMLDPSLTIAR